MKKVTKYEASDGSMHDTKEACLEHEAKSTPVEVRLAGEILTSKNAAEDIAAAMRYKDDPDARRLAGMLEDVGRICAAARVAGGGAKRKLKGKANGAPQVGSGSQGESKSGPGGAGGLPTRDNPFPAHRSAENRRADAENGPGDEPIPAASAAE